VEISEDGYVGGSVNRAELVAAYNNATDEQVKANLHATALVHGMYIEDGKLVDPTAPPVEPEPEPLDLSSLKKDELVAEAEAAGIDPAGKTKAQLVEELTAPKEVSSGDDHEAN